MNACFWAGLGVCVCVSARAAGVCVTVLDVFDRHARDFFIYISLIRLLLIVPAV